MDERDGFNQQAEETFYELDGTPREPDAYPDGAEVVVFLEQWQEAETLGVDPTTLDRLERGGLEL